MTFRCALRFEPDKAKGPGYGLILASCPGFSAAPNTLLYMIKDPSNGMSLGPNGWQPGDAHLVPDAVAPSGEILSLSVGPAVVDSLELQAIIRWCCSRTPSMYGREASASTGSSIRAIRASCPIWSLPQKPRLPQGASPCPCRKWKPAPRQRRSPSMGNPARRSRPANC